MEPLDSWVTSLCAYRGQVELRSQGRAGKITGSFEGQVLFIWARGLGICIKILPRYLADELGLGTTILDQNTEVMRRTSRISSWLRIRHFPVTSVRRYTVVLRLLGGLHLCSDKSLSGSPMQSFLHSTLIPCSTYISFCSQMTRKRMPIDLSRPGF